MNSTTVLLVADCMLIVLYLVISISILLQFF